MGIAGGVVGDGGDGGDEEDARVLGAGGASGDQVADAMDVVLEGPERSGREQSVFPLSRRPLSRETFSGIIGGF